MTLAELIAEAGRLDEAVQSAIDMRMPTVADDAIARKDSFYIEHGPRLVRVAEAAMDIREEYVGIEDGLPWLMRQKLAAFDAEVRGEK